MFLMPINKPFAQLFWATLPFEWEVPIIVFKNTLCLRELLLTGKLDIIL